MSPQNAAADLAARGVMPRTSGAVSVAFSAGDEAGAAAAFSSTALPAPGFSPADPSEETETEESAEASSGEAERASASTSIPSPSPAGQPARSHRWRSAAPKEMP